MFFNLTFRTLDVGVDDFILAMKAIKVREIVPHDKARSEYQAIAYALIGILL